MQICKSTVHMIITCRKIVVKLNVNSSGEDTAACHHISKLSHASGIKIAPLIFCVGLVSHS